MTDDIIDPAVRDLEDGNRINAERRAAEAKAYNIALAKRNPVRRAQALALGLVTQEEIDRG